MDSVTLGSDKVGGALVALLFPSDAKAEVMPTDRRTSYTHA